MALNAVFRVGVEIIAVLSREELIKILLDMKKKPKNVVFGRDNKF